MSRAAVAWSAAGLLAAVLLPWYALQDGLGSGAWLTGLWSDDAAADGLGPIPHNPEWTGRPDAELRVPPDFEVFLTPNPPLSTETVRYVGEPVALVVAETRALAADAAEQVEVDWEPLPAVAAARDALDPDRPRAKHALDMNFVGGDIGQMRPRNGSRGCERSGTALRQRSGAQGQH